MTGPSALQQIVLRDRHRASHQEVENCVDNGEFMEEYSQPYKGYTHETFKFYYNCNYVF